MLGKNIKQDVQLMHYFIKEHMKMLVGKINKLFFHLVLEDQLHLPYS